jgi:hypothetical protein
MPTFAVQAEYEAPGKFKTLCLKIDSISLHRPYEVPDVVEINGVSYYRVVVRPPQFGV